MALNKLANSAILSALGVFACTLPALAQQGRGGGYNCPLGPGGLWGGGWFGVIFMWLFWGLVIVALVGGVRWLFRANPQGGGPQAPPEAGGDPLTILKARYAKGEITKEEFEKIKADIS